MTWRLRRHDPSFSSIKEKSFESRRVRTHPCTKSAEIGALLRKAFFTEVGASATESVIITSGSQEVRKSNRALPVHLILEDRSTKIGTIYPFRIRVCWNYIAQPE